MNKYPVLGLIVKFGAPAAIAVAVIAFLLIAWVLWGLIGAGALVVGAFVGGLLFLVAKSYVELVTIITEMLLPQ